MTTGDHGWWGDHKHPLTFNPHVTDRHHACRAYCKWAYRQHMSPNAPTEELSTQADRSKLTGGRRLFWEPESTRNHLADRESLINSSSSCSPALTAATEHQTLKPKHWWKKHRSPQRCLWAETPATVDGSSSSAAGNPMTYSARRNIW